MRMECSKPCPPEGETFIASCAAARGPCQLEGPHANEFSSREENTNQTISWKVNAVTIKMKAWKLPLLSYPPKCMVLRSVAPCHQSAYKKCTILGSTQEPLKHYLHFNKISLGDSHADEYLRSSVVQIIQTGNHFAIDMVLNSLCQGRALLALLDQDDFRSTYLIIYPHSLPEHIHPTVCINSSTSIPVGSSLDRTCTERPQSGARMGWSFTRNGLHGAGKGNSVDPNLHHLCLLHS